MLKISHYNTIYFLRNTFPRYMKCLFTNTQKQQIILKSCLLFKKKFKLRWLIKNAKFSEYCFYISPNIERNFQIFQIYFNIAFFCKIQLFIFFHCKPVDVLLDLDKIYEIHGNFRLRTFVVLKLKLLFNVFMNPQIDYDKVTYICGINVLRL